MSIVQEEPFVEPPPPARRDQHPADRDQRLDRTTSACAERPLRPELSAPLWSNHLRLRGETRRNRGARLQEDEPPPPARRDQLVPAADTEPGRTTSACAERPPTAAGGWWRTSNHLRLRGETEQIKAEKRAGIEPPPPARRDPLNALAQRDLRRTTSACAERPRTANSASWTASNHLRLRGETANCSDWKPPMFEPPPPARRDRRECRHLPRRQRTTSACAERPTFGDSDMMCSPNHLRLRGETAVSTSARASRIEPPPPARRDRQNAEAS